MPPLPVPEGEDHLEEPHAEPRLAFNGRSFSPGNTLVRNTSIGTTTLTVANGGATHVSGLTGSTAQNLRELLLQIYTQKASSHVLTKQDEINISEVAKNHVIGRLKFILPDRQFPSFWQPDLLTNTQPYVDAFFDYYGSRYRDRKMNDNTLRQAAELWKAAAPKIKKIVDNHRSGVAQKMKSDILTGKLITMDYNLLLLRCLIMEPNKHLPSFVIGLTYLATRGGESGEEDKAFFKANPIYNEKVLDGLETLFQSYVNSEDPKKLARIRVEDITAFHAFAVLCLKHTIGVMAWKLKHRKELLSKIFSISDEALALVILENNAQVWKDKAYGTATDNTQGRYMKKSKDGSVRKDWSEEGKERFNDLFCQVREKRAFSSSSTNETALKALWNTSSRSPRRRDIQNDGVSNNGGEGRVTFIYEG